MKTPVEIVLEQVKLPFEKLHQYQVEDINRFAVAEHCAPFLDMGLGKTIEAIMIACYKLIMGEFEQCIVLMPAALTRQWHDTIEPMGPSVTLYAGTPAQRRKMKLDTDFLVMSFQIFQRDYERLKDIDAYFIVDEATVLCNHTNLIWRMLNGAEIKKYEKVPGKLKPKEIVINYPRINRGSALLTATPVNKPLDAFGLIETKTPGLYDSFGQFERIHVKEVDYFGSPKEYQNLDMLKENLMINAVRRLATDHLDLPPLVPKLLKYDLDPKHLTMYRKVLKERVMVSTKGKLIDAKQVMKLYHWAQRLILNPEYGGYEKDPVGLEVLDGIVGSVDQFLCFGNYTITNEKIKGRYGIGAVYGKETPARQQKYISAFKAGELKGLTCHPKSGGYGLDLPMCHYVVFPELPYTPRDFIQSCARCFRQGQEQTVFAIVMVAMGTIQETLMTKFFEKDDLMAEVVRTERSLRDDLLGDTVIAEEKTKKEILKELLGEEK